MATPRKSRPPLDGFFVVRDVAAEHVGVVDRARRPMVVEPPPPEPVPAEITRTMSKRRIDPRVDEQAALRSEVAFGNVSVKRGPVTIPARSNEPAVIAGSKANRIIDELGRCGPGAEMPFLSPMRALGDVGLEALRRDFPGLLWFDRNLPHQREPRGRDVSPVASLLYQLGRVSIPVISELLGDEDVDRRYYAMLLALDASDASLLDAVELRLFDEDASIATHAMTMLHEVGGPMRIDLLGRALAVVIATPGAYRRQMRAIDLAAALRHPEALEALVGILDCGENTLATNARASLRVLTAHDFGARSSDWAKFVRSRKRESRYAWLLDALVCKEVALRDLAAAELAILTGRSFGYCPGCAIGEAKAARATIARSFRR